MKIEDQEEVFVECDSLEQNGVDSIYVCISLMDGSGLLVKHFENRERWWKHTPQVNGYS